MIMYAKILPTPPKFDYPYQQQQRYSGSFVVASSPPPTKELSAQMLKDLEETARTLKSPK